MSKKRGVACVCVCVSVCVCVQSWVARVNAAEAEVWRRSQGVRSGWADEILGFDCGGQQWVHEVR